MKIKTGELTDAALDYAVAKCRGREIEFDDPRDPWLTLDGIAHQPLHSYTPSTDWGQGGPIIEREGITTSKEDGGWSSYFRDNLFEDDGSEHWQTGPTPLVAAMRCFVASKLGDEVEIPDQLL